MNSHTAISMTATEAKRSPAPAPASAAVPRRVLVIAYAFPPVGGVSVQRVTKFVKFLPEFGWTSSVLTVANPSVPVYDEALLGEVPSGTQIARAWTMEPGYGLKSAVAKRDSASDQTIADKVRAKVRDGARRAFNLVMQPDPQILWRPYALREGLKLLRENPHDVIFATGPPFSSLLLGMTLSKRTGIPLVADFRDEWTIMTYWENKQFGVVERTVQSRMQTHVMKAADLVLGTTPSTADELKKLVVASKGHAEADYIYNGFDPSDYPASLGSGERTDFGNGRDLFRMVFVGTLWNVTPIGPVVDAIIDLARRAPDLAAKLELVIAGRRTDQQDAEIDRLATTPVKLVRLPFVSHKTAIEMMCHADQLLLINADMPNTERLINAKTFEYLAARRPIFLVAPKGELWRLLDEMPGTLMARPGDVPTIAANLESAIQSWRSGKTYDAARWDLSAFERRNLAGRLAHHLDRLAAKKVRQS